jgi:hypothetical protein
MSVFWKLTFEVASNQLFMYVAGNDFFPAFVQWKTCRLSQPGAGTISSRETELFTYIATANFMKQRS